MEEEKMVEIFEIYREVKINEISDSVMFNSSNLKNNKYLKEICKIVNGKVIKLEEGYYLKKFKQPQSN
jgi:hypothetical protein